MKKFLMSLASLAFLSPSLIAYKSLNTKTIEVSENITKVEFHSGLVQRYVLKIQKLAYEDGKSLSLVDCYSLAEKIRVVAFEEGLPFETALLIVAIESSFQSNAYNKWGNAYGLCQVTSVCLLEYNEKHNTNYTLDDMCNIDLNLHVGFWYYHRILHHYNDHYDFLSTSSVKKTLRDAYIAYNIGVTAFHDLGRQGRNELRRGRYPKKMYGYKKGSPYRPLDRFNNLYEKWYS